MATSVLELPVHPIPELFSKIELQANFLRWIYNVSFRKTDCLAFLYLQVATTVRDLQLQPICFYGSVISSNRLFQNAYGVILPPDKNIFMFSCTFNLKEGSWCLTHVFHKHELISWKFNCIARSAALPDYLFFRYSYLPFK